MRNPLKLIAPLVIATGLPLAVAGAAQAVVPSITGCTITPATISLAPGQSENITIGWSDGNTPTDVNDIAYGELSINGAAGQGMVQPIAMGDPSNPVTVPYAFTDLSQALGGLAGTVTYTFYATDGTDKVGSPLCSLIATVAAASSSTTSTTVAPTTLATTGSNTGTFLAGGAMIVAFGGALYVSGRRRSIK